MYAILIREETQNYSQMTGFWYFYHEWLNELDLHELPYLMVIFDLFLHYVIQLLKSH